MRSNKKVVDLFEVFAAEIVSRQRRFGVNLLRERVRWETLYNWGDDEYKFCNTYSPYVARYLLFKHPEWKPYLRCKLAEGETDGVELVTDRELGYYDTSTQQELEYEIAAI